MSANALTRIGPARAALALLALLLVVWFVVLARDQRVGQIGSDRILHDPGMSASEWRHALDQVRQAELLNPGSQWTVTRAGALLLRDKGEARRIAENVLADEPDNLRAWQVLLAATRDDDEQRAADAAQEIRRLNSTVREP